MRGANPERPIGVPTMARPLFDMSISLSWMVHQVSPAFTSGKSAARRAPEVHDETAARRAKG